MSDRLRELAAALAEMEMPSYGVGTAWLIEACPFCEWEGKPDGYTPPEKVPHDKGCPILVARATLVSQDTPQ